MGRAMVRECARQLRDGRVRARDLVERCLERIEALQPATNAFIAVDPADARASADRADAELRSGVDRGLLHGLPLSLKDLFDQQGAVTTAGSRSLSHRPPHDAPAVAALRQHGIVFAGRCNMHEFAMGTTSEDSGFGAVRHPRDPMRSAGGSSGGSAVAVATGMSIASIGSDTGGSIRIPAAACGVVGLKPAWGEVSLDGVVPLSPSLDTVGPLACSVDDAWWVLQGLHPRDLAALPDAPAIGTLRIGVLRRFGWQRIEEPVREGVDQALARLVAGGGHLEDVPFACESLVVPTYVTILIREALDYHGPRLPSLGSLYTPAVRERLGTATRPSPEAYRQALADREQIARAVAELLARVDVLALPGMAILPPLIGQSHVHWPDGDEVMRAALLRLTQPFNLSRHAALVLPAGHSAEGWPFSLQLVGRSTTSLVAAARTIEAALA